MGAYPAYKKSEVLDWSVNEFKRELLYLAWEAHVDKKYSEIMMKKK